MSFKMMNGVEVYDKSEVDAIKENIQETTEQHTSDITQLKTKTNSLENSKASTSQVRDLENSLRADEQRLTGAENNINEHSNRITALENNSATVEQMNQGLNAKAEKTYAQQTRQIANNNSSAISALENGKVNTSDLDNTNTRVTALENRATALENGKADKSDLNDTNTHVTTLENGKADKSEIPEMVNSVIDNVINTKVAGITSDINHIVDNAIDDTLEDYDDSNTVDSKINAAVATRPVAMTTSEAVAIVNQYF
jgi:DNA repair exonuclease SbcCD ATPase subunit